jgi:hypothetical protein
VSSHDIDLYHTVAVCKVPDSVSFAFGAGGVDVSFVQDLDHLNFRELPAGTTFAQARTRGVLPVTVCDEQGNEVANRYFALEEGELRTRIPVMPSMLTASVEAVRQDCLCYLMERHPALEGARRD